MFPSKLWNGVTHFQKKKMKQKTTKSNCAEKHASIRIKYCKQRTTPALHKSPKKMKSHQPPNEK